MLSEIATATETASAAGTEPLRVLVLAMLLVAIVGLARLGVRQRLMSRTEGQLDLEWARLED